jgi:hypothetical protein
MKGMSFGKGTSPNKKINTTSSFYGKGGIQTGESKQQYRDRKRVERIYSGMKNKTSYEDVAKKLQKGDAFKAGKTKDATNTIITGGPKIKKTTTTPKVAPKKPTSKVATTKTTTPKTKSPSGFGAAFSAARKSGKRTFKFNDKLYTTRQKGESKQAFEAKFKKPSVTKPKVTAPKINIKNKNGSKKVGVKFPIGRKV